MVWCGGKIWLAVRWGGKSWLAGRGDIVGCGRARPKGEMKVEWCQEHGNITTEMELKCWWCVYELVRFRSSDVKSVSTEKA